MNKLQNIKPYIKKLQRFLTLNNGVLLVALLIASTWVWSTIEAIQRNFTLQQQVDGLSQQISVEGLQNKSLQLQTTYYSSDQYVELSARERLGLAMPGEKVLILPPNTVKPAFANNPTEPQPEAPKSNYAQWMYFLFGKKG